MKIVYLTSRFPYPLDRGDKLRAYHQIRELSRYHEVHLISISDQEITESVMQQLDALCASVGVYVLPSGTRMTNVAKGIFGTLPFQVSYFYDISIKRSIDQRITEIAPEHIVCQMVRMAPYVIDSPIPKSIDYMDCLSANWAIHGTEAIKYLPFVRKIEASRLRKYERQVAKHFDQRYIISERDRRSIDVDLPIQIVPNGVDTDYYHPSGGVEADYEFVFCGNLGYVHNAKAAHYLIDEIAPKMQAEHRVLIAGARPPAWLNVKQSGQVHIAGWTADVRHHYKRGRVMLAPIFSGSGLQNKILEAMAQGIPCVTTPFVNEAIGAEHGVHLYIDDTPRGLLSFAERLIADEELYYAMSLAARAFVCEHYSWAHSIDPILDSLDRQ